MIFFLFIFNKKTINSVICVMNCHHSYLMLALGTIYALGGHIVAPRVEDIRVYLVTAPYQLRKKIGLCSVIYNIISLLIAVGGQKSQFLNIH